jgi:xylulokinase
MAACKEYALILAVDVGTSVLKGALFMRDGTQVRRAEHPLAGIPQTDPLRHEVDAREWIRGLREVALRLGLSQGPRIEAAVVSGNGPTLVAAGADGNPLAPAMTWMDRRGAAEAAAVGKQIGRRIDPSFFLPKALWIRRATPEVYGRTRYFFSCPEYVAYILTGTAVTFLPGPRYERYIWEADAIKKLGMDPDKFPGFMDSGKIVGQVSGEGEAATGVPRGVPVFAAGPDFIVSLLGTGTVVPGRACIRSGTSEGINLCALSPIDDPRLMCLGHPVRGLWNISGIISTSGKALEWFRQASGKGGEDYEKSFQDIAAIPAGANRLLFLPYLAGERAPLWDPGARGAFIGLTLNHGRRDMMRAVVESTAFAIRDVLEVMEEIGLTIEDFRITGNPSRSRLWNQIKADVTGRRILVPAVEDPDLTGDACLALWGLGEFSSVSEAAESIVKIGSVFEPSKGSRSIYDELFPLYRESYVRLKTVFARLGGSDDRQDE